MDNTQTLELQIKSTADGAVKSVKLLNSSLTNTKSTVDNVSKSISKMGKAFSMGGLYVGVKKLSTTFLKWMDLAVDRTEQLNLFNVVFKNMEKNGTKTFSTLGKQATQFQNKMNEAFGTNLTETTKYQGLFQSMGENVGIPDTYSALMSTTMTKLTYDLASLYNKQENVVAEALRAGVYAGQTKPLRSYGIDVTQISMQPILDSLGITDRSVKQMSQAEKEILRYLATLRQAKVAMGDFANTIESPANQLKIFKQQLVEAKVALSSLFIGTFSQILPYANAILMVLKELSKAIATMFGIELSDYNTGIADSSDAFVDLEDSIDGAVGSAKELKRQTLGFDQINNINENKDSGSGGASVSGGIDQRLLDAIYGYDNGMDKVRMKATEIRDRIMEWLGFTKKINSETGELSWEFEKITGGTVLGALAVGGIIVTGISKIFSLLNKIGLLKFTGITKILSAIKNGTLITTITTKFSKLLPVLGKASGAIGGLAGVIFGSKGTYDAMKKMTKETKYGGEAYGKYTTSVLGTVGGATALGAVIGGPLGAGIGALTGVVVAGISAWQGYKAGIEELAKEELFGSLTISTEKWLDIMGRATEDLPNYGSKYEEFKDKINSLKDSFDTNLNSLETYGIQFGKLQQQITEEDSVKITQSIDGMCSSTSSMIEENSNLFLSVWGTSFEKMSTLTEEEEKNILNSVMDYSAKQQKELKDAQNNITKTYDNAIKTRGYLTDEEYRYIQEQLAKIKALTQSEMSTAYTDMLYMQEEFSKDTSKLSEESYEEFSKALKQYTKEQQNTISDNYNTQLNLAQAYYKQGAIDYDQYQQMVKTANEERKKSENDLQVELKKIQKSVYGDLAQTYKDIKDLTDKESKAQKKLIEGIFKDIDIDANAITRVFSDIGHGSGKAWRNSFISEMDKKIQFNAEFNNGGAINKSSGYYKFKAYANGGFPEDGWFRASHGEIMGKFDNGKSVVANNMQITEGIKQAVMQGMDQVMSRYGGHSNQIDVHVHSDEGVIVDRINQTTKQTGVCPINIPIN